MRCACPLLVLGAAALLAGAGRAQEWRTEFSYTWADNLSRTFNRPDQENAAVWDGSVTAEWRRQLAPDWTLLAQGETGAEQVPAYPGIDGVHAGGRLEIRRKFGLGPFAPVLAGWFGATRTEVHDRGRSNWKTEGGLSLAKRLTDTWRVSAAGSWEQDYAKDHPFDVCHRRLALDSTWDVRDGWQLGAGAGRLWGELTANENEDVWTQAVTGGYGPRVSNYYRTLPWEYSTGFESDWVAYRVDGRADLWWVGLSVELGEHTSLPLRYESVRFTNRAGLAYDSEFWSLSLVHRF